MRINLKKTLNELMKLYIIGNGFDIAHGILCRFSDFYTYLEENRYDVLEEMEQYYDIYKDSDLWSDFERELEENICYDSLVRIIIKNTPNFSSDDFRDSDWYDAELEIENKCNELLDKIRSSFEEWINSLELNIIMEKYDIDKTARFFTFNYTKVLELVYRIPTENVIHIHNKVGEKLIFGHGKKVKDFNVKKALYRYDNTLLDKEIDGIMEYGHEKFAENAVCEFYDKMSKHTDEIINTHLNYFSSLSDIDEVIVIGHSYNEIDFPYFKKISESVNNEAIWILHYFSDNDRLNAERLMNKINRHNNFVLREKLKMENRLK